MAVKREWLHSLLLLSIANLLLSQVSVYAAAGVVCNTDDDCGSNGLIRGVSVCENGKCTNPFEKGCLKAMSEKHGKKEIRYPKALEQTRICNSDDGESQERCREKVGTLAYDEVRIAPSNWESAIFMSWIYQIVLTEMLEVPATMKYKDGKKGAGSFYDRSNGFDVTNDSNDAPSFTDTLLEADKLDGDCSKTDKPCAHILPDVWKSRAGGDFASTDGILPSTPNGIISRFGFYVPAYTAKKHPELSTIFGLSNDLNQASIAETFPTPTNWEQYCNMYDCNSSNDVATRKPQNDNERKKYYAPPAFNGYFRNTTEMGIDCVNQKQETCYGHIVTLDNSDCELKSFLDAQLKWNGIPLVSRGPSASNNGYSEESMLEIWEAARMTSTSVMMWWWFPHPAIETYEKTDFKFYRINFPRPTENCINYRRDNIDYCSTNSTIREGFDGEAACDYPVEKPQKYMTRALKTNFDSVDDEERSPVYPFMDVFEIPTYAMEEIFEEWMLVEKDYYGYDTRVATCKWVYDNIEMLELYIPRTYPRETNEKRNDALVISAFSVSSIALIAVLLIGVLTLKFREKKAIRFAQVGFLLWMILGLIFVAIGAVTSADPSSDAVCVASEWSILIGYTLELAPILVKVQAINRVTREAMRFRRLEIDQNKLKKYPILFVTPVLIYLIVWTIVDMPKSVESLAMDKGGIGNIVDVNKSCGSNYEIWSIMAYVWQSLLLLSASVLAFQSRDVIEEMNESQWIAFLMYSHFMCLIFRIVIRGLSLSGSILGSVGSSIVSIVLSIDVLACIVIYFGPKFYNIATEKSLANQMKNNGLSGAGNSLDYNEESHGNANDLSVVARLRKAGVKVIRSESAVSRMSSTGYDKSSEEKSEEKSPVEAFPLTISAEANSNERLKKSIDIVESVHSVPDIEIVLSGDKDDDNDDDEEKQTLLSSEKVLEESSNSSKTSDIETTKGKDEDEEKQTLLASEKASEENNVDEAIDIESPKEKDVDDKSSEEEKLTLASTKPSEENDISEDLKDESPSVFSLIDQIERKCSISSENGPNSPPRSPPSSPQRRIVSSPTKNIIMPSLENDHKSEENPQTPFENFE